jgi:hydrogenase/urease accessory protein HupE
MSSRKFILFFTGIFCLGALPIIIAQPSGAASAGLSAGFALPLEHPVYVVLCVLLGLLASLIGRDGPVFIPAALLALLVMGHLLGLDMQLYPATPYMILASVLLVVLVAGILDRRAELMGVMLASSLGFQMGWHTIRLMPEIASPLYFLMGVMLSVLLITAVAISLGLTLFSDEWVIGRTLRESPRLSGLRSLFR